MVNKTQKLQQASDNIKHSKIVLYHVITPISAEEFAKIEQSGYFKPSSNALGGQSNGFYFFTSRFGADYHIKTMQNTWDISNGKHAYVVECEIDAKEIKYPNWKLDYEAMQDFLFDMIYDSAHEHIIKFNGIEIKALDDKKLSISENGKFSRIKTFNANEHSGLIEKISDFLYNRDDKFKTAYDKLLFDVFYGNGENQELYAVKTTTKHKITKAIKIEPPVVVQTHSQIDKFFSRYSKTRR